MQNREVPLGSLPIFFSSLRLAEAGRTCPEVRGGETGRGTRATVRGTQKTEPRARARGAGRRRRGHGHGAQETRVRGAGRGCGTRKTRARGAGRRTRATGRGQQNTGNAGTGRRRRGIGDGAQAPVHGPQRDCIHPPAPQQPAGAVHSRAPSAAGTNPPGPFTAGRPPPGPATTRRAIHSRAPSATGTCNNPPGPSTAGRLPPRAAPYLSRVRIRITPLPPRTPYMLLPRCTSTDLTS